MVESRPMPANFPQGPIHTIADPAPDEMQEFAPGPGGHDADEPLPEKAAAPETSLADWDPTPKPSPSAALEAWQRDQELLARMKGPGIIHGTERARMRREAEEATEARRKASDPRAALDAAKARRAEATAAVLELEPKTARAAELVRDLEEAARGYAADRAEAEAQAAEDLRMAIAAGAADLSVPAPAVGTKENPTRQLAVARQALAAFEVDLVKARDLQTQRTAGVMRAALDALADEAADQGNAILAAGEELARQRVRLGGLMVFMTSERRRLGISSPLSPAIDRALDHGATSPQQVAAAETWRQRFTELQTE